MADALYVMGIAYDIKGEYSTALDLHRNSLNIRREINDEKGIALSLGNIGMINAIQGENEVAIDFYRQSLSLFEKLGERKKVAATLNNMANLHKELGDYALAINIYFQSLRIKEELGEVRGIVNTLINIGIVFHEQRDFVKADQYFNRGLQIADSLGDKYTLASLSRVIALNHQERGNYQEALNLNNRSLSLFKEIGDKRGIAQILNNMGNIHHEQKDFDKALDHYQRSLSKMIEVGDKQGMATALGDIGRIYQDRGEYAKAIEFNNQALKLAQEAGAAIESRDAAGALYEAYNASGKYKSALQIFELYIAIRDSLENEENQREVIRQEYEYEYQKQALADSLIFVEQQKLQESKIEKNRLISIFGGILLITIITSIYIRNRSLKSFNTNLKENQRKLMLTQESIDASNDNIFWVDPNNARIIDCNSQSYKELGYSKNELLSLSIFDVNPDFHLKMWDNFSKNLKEKGSLKFETRHQTKTGHTFPVDINAVHIQYHGEEFFCAIVRDITIRKEAEEELQKAKETAESTLFKLKETQSQLIHSEKMASLGQLTAGVAHEINNPINFVKGGSAALTNDFQDLIKLLELYSSKYSDKDIDKLKQEIDLNYLLENVPLTIDDIKTGADRTADIVNGLRSFARLDEGEKQTVDIHECIDSTLLLISQEDTGHIELVKNYQEGIEPLACYPGQLNQAFLNIINNARDTMKDGGKLMITTSENNGQVSISFKDTGPGIPEDIKDKIFDPFFTTKDVGEGTGLGLSITHGIIENHGGSIEVESEVGKGSEFIITIPIRGNNET